MNPDQLFYYRSPFIASEMHSSNFYNDILGGDYEDKLGLTVSSGQVKIFKDQSNLIGISIGGGAPNCPCLYVIQIFDNSPVSKDGTLEPGDEITAINGISVKGSSKSETARAIQTSKEHVVINYNKLHVDTDKAKSLDILLKKVKHRVTEAIGSSTSDAFGLSRAILCNDNLAKRLEELERNEIMYSEIRDRTKNTFKAFKDLNRIYRDFGDVFTEIGCREKQPEAGELLRRFGEIHRLFEKYGLEMVNSVQDILGNLDTYINKAIPDTRLTIKRYQDIKFEYLSYCLKVKEMDDEEKDYYSIHEPLYRVETGNYEYRLVLRCRQEAKKRFSQLRSDVTAKIELLDQKHVQHLSSQLLKMTAALSNYNKICFKLFQQCNKFPLDLDLSQCFDFNYINEQDLTETEVEAETETQAEPEARVETGLETDTQEAKTEPTHEENIIECNTEKHHHVSADKSAQIIELEEVDLIGGD